MLWISPFALDRRHPYVTTPIHLIRTPTLMLHPEPQDLRHIPAGGRNRSTEEGYRYTEHDSGVVGCDRCVSITFELHLRCSDSGTSIGNDVLSEVIMDMYRVGEALPRFKMLLSDTRVSFARLAALSPPPVPSTPPPAHPPSSPSTTNSEKLWTAVGPYTPAHEVAAALGEASRLRYNLVNGKDIGNGEQTCAVYVPCSNVHVKARR